MEPHIGSRESPRAEQTLAPRDQVGERVRKVVRYVRIYGFRRTWFKVAGRLRLARRSAGFGSRSRQPSIAMLGCGQFAFATIGYFLSRRFVRPFAQCFDISARASQTFARFYDLPSPSATATAAIQDARVQVVYIASNHSSHATYAIAALEAGKDVYVEKPIAVSIQQMRNLAHAVRGSGRRIHAGYNRPFSAAIRKLRAECAGIRAPLTLSCFVSGHVLAPDHWYRDPDEGTRICGNVGHWLDLAVHMLCWGELPDRWRISLAWSDQRARDDDVAIALVSERGDLVNIVLTARTEPFEGINETINLQWGDLIAKIDDFRRMDVWRGADHRRYRYWPKDVGHGEAILQPFRPAVRPWRELELSTLLMLRVAQMVVGGERFAEFSFEQQLALLERETSATTQ